MNQIDLFSFVSFNNYGYHIWLAILQLIFMKISMINSIKVMVLFSYNRYFNVFKVKGLVRIYLLGYFRVSCSEPILLKLNAQPRCSNYRIIILTSFMINIAVISMIRLTIFFFDQNRRFLRYRLATPAKHVVKSILKFLQKICMSQFGSVVKHQAANSEVTGSNPAEETFSFPSIITIFVQSHAFLTLAK